MFCLAENAVGPIATRPDDIHTLYSGKWVHVHVARMLWMIHFCMVVTGLWRSITQMPRDVWFLEME